MPFFLAVICASCITTVTTAERMFGIVKEALAFAIGAEFFDALRIGNLLSFNKDCITLAHLARDHHKLRHWVRAIEKTAIGVRAHCASTKQSGAFSTKQMNGAVFFCINNRIVVF
jgi:hypothetical protein